MAYHDIHFWIYSVILVLVRKIEKGKHLFGMVNVGDKGQIVIPARARKLFDIKPGDQLVVLGDESQGIAIMKANDFLNMANLIRESMNK